MKKRKLVVYDKQYNHWWGKNVSYAIKDKDENWWIANGPDENYVCQDPDLKKKPIKQYNINKYTTQDVILLVIASALGVSLAFNILNIIF